MVGTKAGGLKAAATNRKRYGDDFFRNIGREGGINGKTGGFASNPELARLAGAKGGKKSRRGKPYTEKWEKHKKEALKMHREGRSYVEISKFIGIPYSALRLRVIKELET